MRRALRVWPALCRARVSCRAAHTTSPARDDGTVANDDDGHDKKKSDGSDDDAASSSAAAVDDVVTPWSVTAKGPRGIDYDRVLTKFKAQRVDAALLQRLRDVVQAYSSNNNKNDSCSSRGDGTATAPPPLLHHFLTRDVAFSHRDLHLVLHELQRARGAGTAPRVYLYTGRGPSTTSMHLGHVLPFLLTRYLQATFALPLVIQLTDDEKFLFRDVDYRGDAARARIDATVRDIIAFGFDARRTFIFCNTAYMGEMYGTVLSLQRALTASAVKHTLGLCDSDNVGKLSFCATQAAPCFADAFARVLCAPPHDTHHDDHDEASKTTTTRNKKHDKAAASSSSSSALRCLVPCAIDQDPFFVLTRTVAPRLRQLPPALLHTRFLPALRGPTHKMSSSAPQHGVVTLHDSDAEVHAKLRKAFSGGCATLQELQQRGAQLDVDVAYQFLRFFCDDEDVFANVTRCYRAGTMHSGDVKACAADVVIRRVLRDWRARRARVTDDDVAQFMRIRNIMVD